MKINSLRNNKIINSKILLFGEYTILLDGPALAMPYDGFTGALEFLTTTPKINEENSYDVLRRYLSYLKNSRISEYFLLDIFKNDLDNGLFFSSNIPQGYGLGSSGALCAAIAQKYGNESLKNQSDIELKRFFAFMESFFHGKSSGIDPLVIYLNSPLQIERDEIKRIDILWNKLKINNLSIFLLDTDVVGETEPLVKWFKKMIKTEGYNLELSKYISVLKIIIHSFLDYNKDTFINQIKNLSELQLKLFSPMIPEHILPVWEEGVKTEGFYLKLCGSGGGGYMLGFSSMNKAELTSVFRNKNMSLTYIT